MYPLCQRRIKAGAADFNEAKVEPCGECDRVNQATRLTGCIIICSGDSRMLPRIQTRYGLDEVRAAEVRVRIVIPVSTPKTGVYRKLGKVGKPRFLGRPRCPTTDRRSIRLLVQRAKMRSNQQVELRGVCSFRFQISEQKVRMTEFIISIVQNVLRHVSVQNLQGFDVSHVAIGRSQRSTRLRIVRREIKRPIAEFPVLFPKIALDDLGGAQETQNCPISLAQSAAKVAVLSFRTVDQRVGRWNQQCAGCT